MYQNEQQSPPMPVWSFLVTLLIVASRPYVQTLHVFLRRSPGLGYYWGAGVLTIPGLAFFNYCWCVILADRGELRLDRGWPFMLFVLAVLMLGIRHQWRAWRRGSSSMDTDAGDALRLWHWLRILPVEFSQWVLEPLLVWGVAWLLHPVCRPLSVHLTVAAGFLFFINCLKRVVAMHTRRAMHAVQADLRAHNPRAMPSNAVHGAVRVRGARR